MQPQCGDGKSKLEDVYHVSNLTEFGIGIEN